MTDDNTKVIIRTESSGVHYGTITKFDHHDRVVTLRDSRRIWFWAGAATLSELALAGPARPDACKFPAAVPEITVLGVIEVIPVSAAAQAAIEQVPVWTAH